MALNDVKFAHGKKANVEAAIAAGKIDKDDFILFSDTDDELGFVTHEGTVKTIKARTNSDIENQSSSIGSLEKGMVIPAGTSLDDFIAMICAEGEISKEDILETILNSLPKDENDEVVSIREYVNELLGNIVDENGNKITVEEYITQQTSSTTGSIPVVEF